MKDSMLRQIIWYRGRRYLDKLVSNITKHESGTFGTVELPVDQNNFVVLQIDDH